MKRGGCLISEEALSRLLVTGLKYQFALLQLNNNQLRQRITIDEIKCLFISYFLLHCNG